MTEAMNKKIMSKTRIIVVGSKGRMGEALLRLGARDPALEIVAGVDKDDDILTLVDRCDVLVEFAHHSLSGSLAGLASERGKALVIGTTGHTSTEREAIRKAAARIPIVLAPNFSVGVNLLFYLTQIAAETFGSAYDQEVVEMHHHDKLDAPSGTARRLGEILAQADGGTYDEMVRTKREIGMHALRGGDVVGDHTVHFATPGERLELTHRASSRDTFASGALRAAGWVHGKTPALYSMQDVLGFGRKSD
jgi:4-hydroxy-tetrahydrodipicolinate reductase